MRTLLNQMGLCRKLQVAVGIGAVVGTLLFYAIGMRPAQTRLESLRLQIKTRQRELELNQNRARNLYILARELEKLEAQVAAYDRQFPRQAEFGQFIKDVTQAGQQSAIQECKYEQGLPRRGEGYCELPITMHFRGDFESVASFIHHVEGLPRLTRVKHLEIKNRDSKTGVVQVDMAVSIYYAEG